MASRNSDHPGGPAPPQLVRLDTDAVGPRDRFDYWRSIFPGVDIEPAERGGGAAFSGETRTLVSATGDVSLSCTTSDPNVANFNAASEGLVLLGAVVAGDVEVRHGRGSRTVLPRRSLYVADLASTPEFAVSRFKNIYLGLPREQAAALLDAGPSADRGIRVLPATPLGRIFFSHLASAAREMDRMDGDEARAALSAAEGLGRALVDQFGEGRRDDEAQRDKDLVLAARRCMRMAIDRPGVTVEELAHMLGRSRSCLYRAFDRQGLGVAEQLRDIRLRHARNLLAGTEQPVGEIALACGYADFSAFSRAFRRHAGSEPREYRRSHRTGGQGRPR